MKMLLKRIAKKENYTIGKLYIDGLYFCDTLEDTDRHLVDEMRAEDIKRLKVYAKTAIPKGVYGVTITYSPRFKRLLPLINNVKGFEGIRIHSGNTAEDTEGCILVGKNKSVGKVLESRDVFNRLFALLVKAKERKEAIFMEVV